MRSDVDWKKMQEEYITGDISVKKLAEKYDVPEKTVRNHAARDGWTKQREDYREKRGKKIAGILSEEYFSKINISADKLLKKLERAVNQLDRVPVVTREKGVNEDGHEYFRQSVEYEKGKKINVKELNILTSTLEKLLEIGRSQTSDGTDEVKVSFEGELEEYSR